MGQVQTSGHQRHFHENYEQTFRGAIDNPLADARIDQQHGNGRAGRERDGGGV